MTALLLALGILGGADAATTCHNLRLPGQYETNQFIGKHPSCRTVILTKAASVGGATIIGLGLHPKHPKLATWTVSAVVTYNGVTVGWNLYQVGKRP